MMNKTMMKLVVGTEAMFFLSLIVAFIYMAYNSGFEPHNMQQLDIKSTGIFTIILIGSSITLLRAEHQYKKGNIKSLKIWLIATIVAGAVFMIGQGKEYWRLAHENVTPGNSVFGSSFYTLTGFHGLHVFIGLIILSIVLILSFLGDFDKPSGTISTVA